VPDVFLPDGRVEHGSPEDLTALRAQREVLWKAASALVGEAEVQHRTFTDREALQYEMLLGELQRLNERIGLYGM
jgi:hypothetical protein